MFVFNSDNVFFHAFALTSLSLSRRTLEVVASVQSVPKGSLSLKPSTWQTKAPLVTQLPLDFFVTVCARVQRGLSQTPLPILSFFSTRKKHEHKDDRALPESSREVEGELS